MFNWFLVVVLLLLFVIKGIKCFMQRNTISVMVNGKMKHFNLDKLSVEEIKELRKLLTK